MDEIKVGDIVRVDEDFYEINVVDKDYLNDCIVTKLEKLFIDDDSPLLATIERCDGKPFRYIAYDGQRVAMEKKCIYVWESGLELIESRRF